MTAYKFGLTEVTPINMQDNMRKIVKAVMLNTNPFVTKLYAKLVFVVLLIMAENDSSLYFILPKTLIWVMPPTVSPKKLKRTFLV